MTDIRARLISERPVPLWLVDIPTGEFFGPPFDSYSLLRKIEPTLPFCRFRGVELSRLPLVLKSGIDVEPPDAPFYAAFFDKAWEYGGWPKLLLGFDTERLQPTWRQVPATLGAEDFARLKQIYPVVVPIDGGSTLWLSRLPQGDPRVGTDYETEYAWWLPNEQMRALRAILLFARPEDAPEVLECATRIKAADQQPTAEAGERLEPHR